MIPLSSRSRQPAHDAWTHERLLHERAIALGHIIDPSTSVTYNSHLQSYLTFCKMHDFPIEPMANTLSFYIVFMAHHIEPHSITSYLSGICSSLELYFPWVRSVRNGTLVSHTLASVKKLRGGSDPKRKWSLTEQDLSMVLEHFNMQFRWPPFQCNITDRFSSPHANRRVDDTWFPHTLILIKN